MGIVTIPNRPAGSDIRDIGAILANFDAITAQVNGSLDQTNLAPSLAQSAAINQSGQVVKGAVNIATSESRSNTAYGTLTTPDQVAGVVLPANGLIRVWYQATWQESVAGAARAAIFIGANQAQIQSGSNANPMLQAAAMNGALTGANRALSSHAGGLVSNDGPNKNPDVTTGQIVGQALTGGTTQAWEEFAGTVLVSSNAYLSPFAGPCDIFATAGTYTVSVQFKASSGSVTVSTRKLWVQALSFA